MSYYDTAKTAAATFLGPFNTALSDTYLGTSLGEASTAGSAGGNTTSHPTDSGSCDRTTFLGKLGICEAGAAAEQLSHIILPVAGVAAAVTVVAGVAVTGLAVAAIGEATGITPVLSASGRAVARRIG